VVYFPKKAKLSGKISMLLLTGEYEHTIDEKGRLFISNKLRSQIDVDEHGSNFYLVLGVNGILCLYPEKYFQQIALAVAPGTAAPDEAVVFERMSFALASKVELDRQGRLLLSEKLRKRAGLQNSITLIGVRDHIELWNAANWEEYLNQHMEQYQQQMMQARQAVLQKQGEEIE
jgi:MraZ protein